MTSSDGVKVSAPGLCRGPFPGRCRRGRPGPSAIGLLCSLVAGALTGCSLNEGVGPFIVDSGRYAAYHCRDMVDRLKYLVGREKELRNLIDKASEGAGGSVIGALSYRTDYEKAAGEEKVLRRTAVEKKCDLAPRTFESDQIIR